ncbi:MAG TPA: Fur family transcriptional regulator [Candidatus Dormibacteraeota bacterium]|nr:Fur family transcriptional regulator [Candidatus Dormibacteraeota bacterium]
MPPQPLATALRARGHRLTPQRLVILETVERARHHTTAEDVARRVGERFPGVDASTVYRTLELLEREGLVTHTHFDDGVTRWHLASAERHQHLVCRVCGDELELEVSLLEPAARKIRDRFGFVADMAHFSIAGTCAKCQS